MPGKVRGQASERREPGAAVLQETPPHQAGTAWTPDRAADNEQNLRSLLGDSCPSLSPRSFAARNRLKSCDTLNSFCSDLALVEQVSELLARVKPRRKWRWPALTRSLARLLARAAASS